MESITFGHRFESLRVMLAALIYHQHSHEQRDKHLLVMQATVASWIETVTRDWHGNSEQKGRVLRELRACWLLLVPNREHETHSDVRNRLRLVDEICLNSLNLLERDDQREREERWASQHRCHANTEPTLNESPMDGLSQEDIDEIATQSLAAWEDVVDELLDDEEDKQ